MIRRLFGKEQALELGGKLGREFQVGDVLEQRYEIELIRLGFMGVVYIAYDRQRRGRVVLKTFQNKFLWDNEAIARFNTEAELWMRLGSHPNIVRAYDLHEFLGKPHVVAEYVHGGALRSLVGHLSVQDAVEYGIQICWGMRYATEHAAIMHCDLKPDNIMITMDGQAKVTDFGLSRVLPIWQWSEELRNQRLSARMRSTVTEVLGGTLPYMAPELLSQNSSAGTWSDVYAFGVMLYELLTGRLPFDSMRDESLIRMHLHKPVPDPVAIKPGLPPECADVVLRCMAKRPSERFQNFHEVETALQVIRSRLVGKRYTPVWPTGADANRDGWVERGLVHMDLHEYSEAISCFRQAINLDSSKPEAWLYMARSRFRLWQYNEALQTIEEGLGRAESRHEFGQLFQVRGETLAAMMRPKDALAAFDKGLSYTPNAPALWREKGALFLRQNRPREAAQALNKALEYDKLDSQAWRLLGDAYLTEQNNKKAHWAHAEALKLDPRSAEGWTRYGTAQMRLERPKEALRSFDAALKLDPDMQEALDGFRQAKSMLR